MKANSTPQTLPFSQNWTNTGLITANDDWSGVPGIEGFLGDRAASGTTTDIDPQTVLDPLATIDVIANQTNPNTNTTGGVAEFHATLQAAPASTNPTVALQGSGTADHPNIIIYLNTTGQSGINVSYNLRDIDCAAENAVQQVALQYRVGNTGNFTNIAAGYVADATTGPSICTLVTPVSAALPAAADNQAQVQVRIITSNANSSDEWVGIDDISITGTGTPADVPPTVQSTTPADNATNVAASANISVTFSEPVTATTSSFTISCSTSGAHAFTLSGGPTTYTLDPTTDFTAGEVCTVTVVAAQVADQDGTPNNMAANFVFDFTVAGGAPTPIHTIQGSGTASPLLNQVVTTTGIVTLLKTGTNNGGAASAFFIQTPDASADADPNTSQGLLVFTSTPPTVSVGDEVTVTGTVVEFFGMTEISPVTNVSVIDTGNTLPTPVTLTTTILDPTAPPTQPQLEKYEGMRMSAASLTSTAPNDNFFDVYTVITGVPRPLREPGIEISKTVPPDPTTGVPDCCVPRWDENPERLLLDTNARAGAPLNPYTSKVTFTNVAGPLDFSFNEYRLIPDASLTATANMSAVPVPVPATTEFTVGAFNVENFNNNATQRQKAALAIRDVMRLPGIIGMIEIFDLADLQALAAEVNTISPGVTYTAHLVEADSTSEDSDQDVGFLVDTSRVQINSVVQRNATETYINPNNGQPELLNDRPPLVLNANVQPAGANVPVIVVVNHLRSFIDIDQDPGEGPRVRAKRKAQAESLAALLQEYQANNPATSVISVGDYNAYQFSDGYTDPIATIKGNPTPDDQIVVDQSPDLVNPNFFNLVDELPAEERYSFNFEGTLQALDHVLVNTVAHDRNTRFAIARNNADFPEVPAAAFASNAARPERNSDHDMPVAYFSLVPLAQPGQVIISELRFRGPNPSATPGGGENNEFIELYNNTNSDITVASSDGSEGWSVAMDVGSVVVAASSAPAVVTRLFVIPNGTVIPARAHYLAANTIGYSLQDYGGPGMALPDNAYSVDVPDTAGVALFTTANTSNYDTTNRLDSAGFFTGSIALGPSTTNPLFYEGTGLSPFVSFDNEHSFVRRLESGLPRDTNDNGADFLLVSTQPAAGFGGPVTLGAPGPENLSSPIQRNGRVKSVLLDNQCSGVGTAVANPAQGTAPDGTAVAGCQNRARDLTAQPLNNSGAGTLFIRRKFINTTSQPVTRLRFRVVDITTSNGGEVPAGTADLRVLSAGDVTITTTDLQMVAVKGLTLEQPPAQPNGGGYNSTVAAGTITPATPLAPGNAIAVQFRLGVQQTGTFRFFVNVEAVLGAPPVPFAKEAGKSDTGGGKR